ncbi:RNA polymerase sigma factor [Polaribacter sp. SA4-12]|uniref:RNA polymerase sigma factor n=1 Tax=Polaribacter sp. SA4-12 TaxID=1312072 RepID=UPI000B3D3D68|nr:RNA polymerase sigma factor [Polaribacter sp. SA4-12]
MKNIKKEIQRHLKLCNLAFFIVKDADVAKDIAQESWIIIIHKLETLQETSKFKSWAISIVNRRAIDWIRTNNRERIKLEKSFNESEKEDSFSKVDDTTAIKKVLLEAIEKLSVEHQMVLRLFYKESYSLKEISDLLQISIGTTKSRLFHAREKLKTKLKHSRHER